MAKIHGIVYILIGAFIALVSWQINFDDLKAFFYVGLFFAAVGLFKITFSLMKRNEEKKIIRHKTHPHHLQSPSQSLHSRTNHINMHSQRTNPAPLPAHSQYKRCKVCHNIMSVHDNFCSKCGNRA